MSKKKWCRGAPILSLDALVKQDVVFFQKKPVNRGWFLSWQLRMTESLIESHSLYYAIPTNLIGVSKEANAH